MNYREKKEERQRELRRIKFILFLVFAAFFLVLAVFSFFVPAESWQYGFALPKVAKRKTGELRIHYLNVGQADSTLIEFPDGKTLLIDAGDTHSDARIIRYLNALKIKELDYLLLTHTDADHCGSMSEIVKYKGAKNILLPCMQSETKYKTVYTEFLSLLEEKGIEGSTVKRFDEITSSNAEFPYAFTVLFPHGVEYDEDEFTNNELSTISYLTYGETDALFCGDTSAKILERLVKEDSLGAFKPKGIKLTDIDVMKIPHHGAEDGIANELISYFNFSSAVISCGKDNVYGHPHEDVLTELVTANCDVYRTDLNGTVVVTISKDGGYQVNAEISQ